MIAVVYSANNLVRPARYIPLAFVLSVPTDMEQKDLFRMLLKEKPALFEQHRNQPWGRNVVLSYDVSSSPEVIREAFEKGNIVPVISFNELRRC